MSCLGLLALDALWAAWLAALLAGFAWSAIAGADLKALRLEWAEKGT